MTTITAINAFADGNVQGLQVAQRDWSPFVAHFTCSEAMKPLGSALDLGIKPKDLRKELDKADDKSYQIVKRIASSGKLMASSPRGKPGVDPCVSLSECTLPGLIALSERYGRFGFVFYKNYIFKNKGRPCIYVDNEIYGYLSSQSKAGVPEAKQAFALANIYVPIGSNKGKIQDYTHEREWRVLGDISIRTKELAFIVVPKHYYLKIRNIETFKSHTIIPIEEIFAWGA
jgi:hypothetical protein